MKCIVAGQRRSPNRPRADQNQREQAKLESASLMAATLQ